MPNSWSSKTFAKVLGINFAILLIFLFSPALLLHFYRKIAPQLVRLFNQTSDLRANYPTYADKKFASQLLNEFQNLPYKYRSFVGWRRENVDSKYTNISGTYNARKSKGEAINKSVWFFGGSTMWGTGASDFQTIPSHFNSLTSLPVYNFGETSWTSRQSLNQLINVIGDNHNPSLTIFYDGVNDVLNQCRSTVKLIPAHGRQQQIQYALKPLPIQKRTLNFILSPYIVLTKKFNIESPLVKKIQPKLFNCDIDQAKAQSIAKHLVNNWHTAFVLSKSRGFKFYGILQPTLFTTNTNTEYFPPSVVKANSEFEIQFDIVYPLILKEIDRYCEFDRNFCAAIIDGTDWLDGTNNIFIDYCHINSLGNKIIAQRLKSVLER